jgi:hypothetical protein
MVADEECVDLFVDADPRTRGVENVYNKGLILLFIGNTKTAIQAYTCFRGSCRLLAKASTLIMITGNQQKKSVKIMNNIRLAKVESWLALVDLTALPALVIVLYITR